MNVCFVNSLLHILGGVETLLARMSDWLIHQGHTVTILTKRKDIPGNLFSPEVRIVPLGGHYRLLFYPATCSYVVSKYQLPAFDVIKSVTLTTSFVASVLANQMPGPVKVIAGMYGPHEYSRHNRKKPYAIRELVYLENMLNNISPSSRVACFGDLIKEMQDSFGSQQSALYWPLPIRDIPDSLPERRPLRGRIVSIGRLAPMKEYNLYMIDVVEALLKRGHDVCYHIYGDGPLEGQMKELIASRQLGSRVILHGRLDYDRIAEVLKDACAFVGMGTAVIEAAQLGVPNLVAVPYDTTGVTYGPIYDFPTECIDQQTTLMQVPRKVVLDELTALLELSPEAYQAECRRVFDHARFWSLETRMKEFMRIVEAAPYFQKRRFYYYRKLFPFFPRTREGAALS